MNAVRGALSEGKSKPFFFVQRFPNCQVGNERICTHIQSPKGRSQHCDDEAPSMRREEGVPFRPTKEGVDKMLCLNLNQGEYLTIGEDVVVQLDSISGDRCKLVINAPKEIAVLRGKVLERNGGHRPADV